MNKCITTQSSKICFWNCLLLISSFLISPLTVLAGGPADGSGEVALFEGPCSKTSPVVFALDWDDTLLPTSELRDRHVLSDSTSMSESLLEKMDIYQNQVIDFLKFALELGPVFVITNGETGWVELSADRFMPKVRPYLSHIRVISARTEYETLHPYDRLRANEVPSYGDLIKWKKSAFHRHFSKFFRENQSPSIPIQLIGLGDGQSERLAAHSFSRVLYPFVQVKTIKLAELPTLRILESQISQMRSYIPLLFNTNENLDLQLTVNLQTVPPVENKIECPKSDDQTPPNNLPSEKMLDVPVIACKAS